MSCLQKKNQKESPRKLQTEKMENFWNDRYEKQPNLYGYEPNVFFASQLSQLNPGKILMPGEGEGRNAIYAASKGWDVTAYDPSHIARKHALLEAEKRGLSIQYLTCDALKFIPEPNSYDAVGLIYLHLPKAMLFELHKRAVMALRSGGKIILEGFGKKQVDYYSGGPANPELLFDLNTIKESFQDIVWDTEADLVLQLHEGIGHSGEAHLIRLAGIKQENS
jgi:hypothetical protein